MKRAEVAIVVILRVLGGFALGAIPAIFLPYSWMNAIHDFMGLGDLPNAPIVSYLARSLSLFYALFYWNDWWHALMFIDKQTLFPLQYQLFNIISDVLFLARGESAMISAEIKVPQETVKMAATLITIGPIVFLYPFVQRYFVKGIMIGAIKG